MHKFMNSRNKTLMDGRATKLYGRSADFSYTLLFKYPYEKKSSLMSSGDLGGHSIRHPYGKTLSK